MSQKFEPKKDEEHAFRFDATPTYLFRLYAPSSAGETNTAQVSSPICKPRLQRFYCVEDYGRDILKATPEQAAERLKLHLRWECRITCNLMSWSSSLLFLLQYGMYRHTKYNEPPSLSDIYLIMIDTREFPKQAFLRDIDAINHYCPPESSDAKLVKLKGWREGGYCFGEYLTQGSLDILGKHSRVSMQQLINTGLFHLCPPLIPSSWNNGTGWPKAVVAIRDYYFKRRPMDQIQAETAKSMAMKSMNERLVFPFAVMMFALQDRDAGDKAMHESLRLIFDENIDIDNITYDLESHRMEELSQFKAIMEFFRSHKQEILGTRDSIGDMVDATQRLTVSAGDH